MGRIILGSETDNTENFIWQTETRDQINTMFIEIYSRINALSTAGPIGYSILNNNTEISDNTLIVG